MAGFLSNLNPVILSIIIAFVGGFVAFYFVQYRQPGIRLVKKLSGIIEAIRKLRDANRAIIYPDDLQNTFDGRPFAHLWREYCESLHFVRTADGEIEAIRATVPAELYFSKEAIVDVQINADLYRHLPGILTGIGIIGTFSGLVWGLLHFKPDNPVASLAPLLHEVTSAFIGSGIAIFSSILVTYSEKSLLNGCYKLVEELNNEIDGLYTAGVGEEYLARLVNASEKNSTYTAALKDALIEDLKQLMHEVAERQIAAQSAQNEALAGQISNAITTSLAGPMQDLMGVVRQASGQQGDAITGLLENLLTAFMAKLDDTFGQQIQNINLAIQKSSDSLGQVQEAMGRLIGDISTAGKAAASEMSSKLEEAMNRAALAQEQMNQQMREFVEELRKLMFDQQQQSKSAMDATMQTVLAELQQAVGSISQERSQQIEQDRIRTDNLITSMNQMQEVMKRLVGDFSTAGQTATSEMSAKLEESMRVAAQAQGEMNQQMREFVEELRKQMLDQQTQSKSAMDETMRSVLTELEQAVGTLSQERSQQMEQDRARSDNLAASTKGLYDGLSANLAELMEDIRQVTVKTEENISAIQRTAASAIDGMNSGAAVMRDAADRFTLAGNSVSGVLDRSGSLTNQMTQTATNLQAAASSVSQAFEEYDRARRSTQDYVLQLQDLIAEAKKEAGVSQQLVADLERILSSLKDVENQSLEYLNNVNGILKKSFEDFGREMAGQVRNMSTESSKHLSSSLNALSGTVESMIASVSKLRKVS